MFRLIFGLPWLIVLLRFLQPLPWPLSIKILVAAVLLVASQYHFISFLSSGSVFSPEFPRPLIIAFNILLGALILLAVLLLALDAVSLVLRIWKGHFPVVPATLRYALALLALGVSSFAVSQAIRVPTVKTLDVAIAGLPAQFDGYRLLQLTDLHISRLFPRPWAEEVVARSNALDADLIVITGDFIDGSVESRRLDVAPLSDLRARDGVYAIPGNHEYFFAHDQWMKHLSGLGLTILENSHTVIAREGAEITLAGVTDLSAPRSGLPPPDLAAALQGAPAGAPVILLDHQPRMASSAAQAGVALQLSGHTHGGMVIGLDRLVARANNGFVSGLYAVGGMQLYVNNGTALWPGFALRLGIPSELTVITLRRA
jgi:hypothetical protein